MTRIGAVATSLLLSLTALAGLTDQQTRGKRIYLRGEGTKPIGAVTTADGFELAGTLMPCVNCHGYDGRGRGEGGVRPANIAASSLLRASVGTRSGGRARGAYTPALLKRAIAMGVDSGKHDLSAAMPRYRMSVEDMDDLLAYLSILGTEKDPGIGEETIAIGVVARDDSVRRVLDEVTRRVNEDGLYGRKLSFRYAADARELQGHAEPFAVIDTTAAADATLAFAEASRMPAIAAASAGVLPEGRYAFTLNGGLEELARRMIAHGRKAGPGGPLIVHDAATASLAASLRAEGEDVAAIDAAADEAALDAKLAGHPVVVFIGGQAHVERIVKRAASRPSPPLVLLPASLAVPQLLSAPATLDRRVVVAFPLFPAEESSQEAALAAAAILLDALQKLGRDVTREQLVDALEQLYRFETGFGRAVTWSATRRFGSDAVYLMTADLTAKRLVATPGWVE